MVATNFKSERILENASVEKIATLRALMANYDLDCYFIPAVDEHLN
ncbi:MAG: hypothetical protein JGK20_27950, partial [Microcoleus sp. PH2017_05_CCC_O_A]|nr:hypothetical protein [Microcoleus sp. PH2017_05_CCC_O_A]